MTGDLSVKAVSGAITVIAGAGGAIDLSAVSGAIALDLESPVPSSVRLNCVSGAMTVRLPHDPDVRVEMSTSNGRAVSSFSEVRASGARGSQKLSGTIGGGTAKLTGKTVSGAVTLLRRSADEEPWDLVIEDEPPVQDQVPEDQRTEHGDTAQDNTVQDSTEQHSTNAGGTGTEGTGDDRDNGEKGEDAR